MASITKRTLDHLKLQATKGIYANPDTTLKLIAALEEARKENGKLLALVADLVAQGCTTRREGEKSVLHHSFISTYEEAFDVLEDAGLLKDIGCEEFQWQSRAAKELEEEVDEWGQSYGRCVICGMPYQIVRPGKGQPACECEKTAEEERE